MVVLTELITSVTVIIGEEPRKGEKVLKKWWCRNCRAWIMGCRCYGCGATNYGYPGPHRPGPRPGRPAKALADSFDSTCGFPGEGPSAPGPGARKKASRPKKMEQEKGQAIAKRTENYDDMNCEKAKHTNRVRDLKKGSFAWARIRSEGTAGPLDQERLLIHSIGDDTALRSYLPAVKNFLYLGRRA